MCPASPRCLLLAVSAMLSACAPTGPGSSTSRSPSPPARPPASHEDAGSTRPPATTETCGNGLDEDGDGAIDEGCTCSTGETQSCHPDRALGGVGGCALGQQTCASDGEFGTWGACEGAISPSAEVCENGIDEDCDGRVDEGCAPTEPEPTVIDVDVSLDGDCLTASCPPEAPYPVGCNIMMEGGDERGCVASTPTGSVVYFQEGDACGAGHVSGTLRCSSDVGVGLNEGNCMINKPTRYYPADRGGCPDT